MSSSESSIESARDLLEKAKLQINSFLQTVEAELVDIKKKGCIKNDLCSQIKLVNKIHSDLIEILADFGKRFSVPVPENATIDELEKLIDNIELRRMEEEKQNKVIEDLLDKILQLRVMSGDNALLDKIHKEANELRADLEKARQSGLKDGSHPFCSLLRLIIREEMNEDEMERAENTVINSYGRALLRAIWRGQVGLEIPAVQNLSEEDSITCKEVQETASNGKADKKANQSEEAQGRKSKQSTGTTSPKQADFIESFRSVFVDIDVYRIYTPSMVEASIAVKQLSERKSSGEIIEPVGYVVIDGKKVPYEFRFLAIQRERYKAETVRK